MCLLQLDPLRAPATYAVIPSSGKRAYCFAVDCMALIPIIKIFLCVCDSKTGIQQLGKCEYYLFVNIKEMILFLGIMMALWFV